MTGLEIYRRELLKWSERVNLVGPEARENLDSHIDEALVAADILKPCGEVLDFGSGGGLPAIPMAIVSPEARFHLVEADQKKWAFLKHVVRECGLNAVIYGDRLDRVLKRFPAELRFSLVTSRAVGNPPSPQRPSGRGLARGIEDRAGQGLAAAELSAASRAES